MTEKNGLLTAIDPFGLVLEYDGGKSPEFRFRIVSQEGDSPGVTSLGLYVTYRIYWTGMHDSAKHALWREDSR